MRVHYMGRNNGGINTLPWTRIEPTRSVIDSIALTIRLGPESGQCCPHLHGSEYYSTVATGGKNFDGKVISQNQTKPGVSDVEWKGDSNRCPPKSFRCLGAENE